MGVHAKSPMSSLLSACERTTLYLHSHRLPLREHRSIPAGHPASQPLINPSAPLGPSLLNRIEIYPLRSLFTERSSLLFASFSLQRTTPRTGDSFNDRLPRSSQAKHRKIKSPQPSRSSPARCPSSIFLGAAILSIIASVSFQVAKKKHEALFIGQWVAPFLILGLYNKMVKQHGSDATSRPPVVFSGFPFCTPVREPRTYVRALSNVRSLTPALNSYLGSTPRNCPGVLRPTQRPLPRAMS